MRSIKPFLSLIIGFIIFISTANAQTHYTPYDDIPGIIKSYKPAYSDDFPDWAKMLYQYPINYVEITRDFEEYMFQHQGEKSPEIRYFKIWQQVISPYVLNDGIIKIPDIKLYHEQLLNTQLNTYNSKNDGSRSNSDWTFLGPKETFWLNESGNPTAPDACPWQVNVYSFDVAPSNENVIYCGTETGFVNKTTNKGMSWQLMGSDYFFGGGITAVAIHPAIENLVYVTGGNQVHKTLDGGNTWTPLLAAGELFQSNRIKINPNNPNIVIAAATTGVYKSSNGGVTWSQSMPLKAYDVEFKADDSDYVYAIVNENGKFAVYTSGDGGTSFIRQLDFPTDINDVSGGLLAVTEDNPDYLLAVMLSSDNTPYLYEANLIGASWIWELLATGSTSNFPMNNGQGYFDLVLEMSPLNEDLIFAGTTTLYKSTNGGLNFNAIGGYSGSFAIHPDIQDMKLLSNGETWVSTDGGMSYTTDNFTSTSNYFARINGLIGSGMWGFDQGWNEDLVVGGRYHNGNTAIADFYQPKALRMGGAESPTGWVLKGKSRHVAFNDLGNGWILPQTAEGEPEGRFIFSKYPNMDEYGGRRGNMVFHPNYYNTIYVGEGNAFWKSIDGGVSYDMLFDFGNKIRFMQISNNNPDVFYADIVNGGLYKSEDGGMSWELKPSLTNGNYGTSYWKGKTFFVISPWHENTIYACLQNGTWSSDIGEVYRSTDGGDTWEDWTGTLSEYTKNMAIQPTADGGDLVYMFTNAINGETAKVYYRSEQMDDWELFNDNYPAGNHVKLGLPFFRDSKLRVAGDAGIWESPLQEELFAPIINPWLEKAWVNCMTDTLQFEDHSIINHDGVSWNWEITPEPEYIDDSEIRNPRVVLGQPGTYSITYSVTKNDSTYVVQLDDAVTATTCPSIDDCTNPAEIPKDIWELVYVDSEETGYPGLAVMSFDDDPSTIWHTRWSTGTDPYPHEIQIDLGETYRLFEFILLNRSNGPNGRIKEYELYISEDTLDWGEPVSTGEFVNTPAPQTITFEESIVGRYFRLVGLSEVNGGAWSSAAEFSFVGCTDITYGIDSRCGKEQLIAFPVPTTGQINISLPDGYKFDYSIVNLQGKLVGSGEFYSTEDIRSFNLSQYKKGLYVIQLTNELGITYRVKVVKE